MMTTTTTTTALLFSSIRLIFFLNKEPRLVFYSPTVVVCSRRAIRSARSSLELSRLTDNLLRFSGVHGLVALISWTSALSTAVLASAPLENAPEARQRESAPSADDKVFCAVLTRLRRIFVLRCSVFRTLSVAAVSLGLASISLRCCCLPLTWLLPRLARLLCVRNTAKVDGGRFSGIIP